MKDKIYISHIYGGKEENKIATEELVRKLVTNYSDKLFISPIHTFGYLYDDVSYMTGLFYCLELLDICDEVWVAIDGWNDSKGVMAEIAYAKAKDKPIKFVNNNGEIIKQ